MSELVGCDVSYIGKIERSEKYPNLKMIFKIAEALEIPAKCLFDFDQNDSRINLTKLSGVFIIFYI